MKKVTMQTIADELGLSKNAVSIALRGANGISDSTRETILKRAAKLGYSYPKKNDSSSVKKNIAFVASDHIFSSSLLNRSFFSHIYVCLKEETEKLGWEISLHSITHTQIQQKQLPVQLDTSKIDGIIILSHLTEEYTDIIINTKIPTVIIDHHYPGMQADSILTNNRFGAYTIIDYLINNGHTKIGFLGNIDHSPSYQERLEGYYLAFKKAALPLPEAPFIKTNIIESDEAVDTYLKSLPELPTAWFCVNDGLMFYTYSYLQKKGLSIPNDISLTCYDNGDLSRLANPNITTMDVDLYSYGRNAFRQLLWRMDNPDETYREILLPSTLLKRDSVANIAIK